ncbi:MAG: nucleotidyltransferase domain-containing protein [Nanoarchaeota archaeon]
MKNPIENEMKLILAILKSPEKEHSATTLSKELKISVMGALKIARRLEEKGILNKKKIGMANIYSLNLKNEHSKDYVIFLLKREKEQANPYIKMWLKELKKINSTASILFGSILTNEEKANDIDVLLIVNKDNIKNIKKEIESINVINQKKIHPLFQTKEDLTEQIKEKNKVILNALKGIFVSGEEALIEIINQ